MACVYNRMTIVDILLSAGADPDGHNEMTINPGNMRTPFVYAIRHRNLQLMKRLLRGIRGDLTPVIPYDSTSHYPVCESYGAFRQFHDDDDVMSILMDAGVLMAHNHIHIVVALVLYVAATRRSSNLLSFLVTKYGIPQLVQEALMYQDETGDTMSYLINACGARAFVENHELTGQVMQRGNVAILEVLMGHFYQQYGDNTARWTEQMVTIWMAHKWDIGNILLYCTKNPDTFSRRSYKVAHLLRWGVHSILPNRPSHYHPSLFRALATYGRIDNIKQLVKFRPLCLQERWFREGEQPWSEGLRSMQGGETAQREVEEFFETLLLESEQAPSLQTLCWGVILDTLKINPIAKVQRLPLPDKLKIYPLEEYS